LLQFEIVHDLILLDAFPVCSGFIREILGHL
jgi:hypothetical protein